MKTWLDSQKSIVHKTELKINPLVSLNDIRIAAFFKLGEYGLFILFCLEVMFGLCGWMRSRKDHISRNSPHYEEVQKTLSEEEQVMLELIYNDLALRNDQGLLSFQNFLLFFGLTGLWGAKLFRQFDEDGRKLISKEEFFYGLSRTAKAPYWQKVQLLFNFFKDDKDNGIKFNSFTKMLYNYSRDEVKEILTQDLRDSPKLNRQIKRKSSTEIEPDLLQRPLLRRSSVSKGHSKGEDRWNDAKTVIEVDYEEVVAEEETSFGRLYGEFNAYKDPGTILELRMNDFTYKVNYCNMITLVKEFARNIYQRYNIDTKTGIFTFQQFDAWIRTHPKLFQSYYTSFHLNVWSYDDGEPNFLTKIDRTFQARLSTHQRPTPTPVYAMMVGDILIIAPQFSSRKHPTKVVCLDGLEMRQLRDNHGFGVQFSHRDDHYPRFFLYFQSRAELESNIESLREFEGDTLYDLYDVHEMIGTGKFSIVYRCIDKETGKSYALKDISTEKLDPQSVAVLDNESEIMKLLQHPQIVRYNRTIRSKEHIYIVAEYVNGRDLYEYVRKRKRLSQFLAAFIIGKILEAVRYMHSLQIIHRDLKPENIMVMFKREKGHSGESIENIKIIDFGLADHQSELDKADHPHGIAGTPNYIAPEIILANKPSAKSDIFSIGSILYFLLSGKLPFSYKNVEYTLLRSAKGEFDLINEPWGQISSEAKDLVTKLLNPNPEKRISLEEALNHPWFQIAKVKKGGPKEAVSGQSDSERQSKESSVDFNSLRENDIEVSVEEVFPHPSSKPRWV